MQLARILACTAFLVATFAQGQSISHDAQHKQITIADAKNELVLRLNYDQRCVLDQVTVRGRQVIAPQSGVCSGINVAGHWFTTRSGLATPTVSINKNTLTINNIVFASDPSSAQPSALNPQPSSAQPSTLNPQPLETWHFTAETNGIRWRIDRSYSAPVTIEDSMFPEWTFADMNTWTGGLLGNGGVIWNKYIETPNATFGTHADSVTFWSRTNNDGLRIAISAPKNHDLGLRFSHQPNNAFSFHTVLSPTPLTPKHNLSRFLSNRQDLWKPFEVTPGTTSIEMTLQALDYDAEYSRGTIKGLNEKSIREVLNTIARYGVIDRGLIGGNGWRTEWVCLHEPWFAQFGLALADPGYTHAFSETLDYERAHAITPEGRVKSRWHHTAGDAMPGTFDSLGFYEAQWGMLLDSQPSYVINVAEEFDLTGDRQWLAGQKSACERALDYLLRRDSDHDGLVEAMTDAHSQQKGSDWIDIIWASHENALLNAELYYALKLWADNEELLGDSARANAYRESAAKLKTAFNRTTAQGGFWNPDKNWYIYWRDKDDSIHGNNLVTPVNFTAIAYGLCDDPARRKAILDRIESEMQKENLFFWPLSFFPYQPDEGHANNFPFPKYENGDIFLSWGELAIRSYASIDPALALKYIKKVLHRYETDGLSFQRYLRESQNGAGDDILSGNCSAVVGLYRDIYGIQPQHNRLYLDPHLVPELNGTQIPYLLRNQRYLIDLHPGDYRVTADAFSVRSHNAFGLDVQANVAKFFPGKNATPALTLTHTARHGVLVTIEQWPQSGDAAMRWTEAVGGKMPVKLKHQISGLHPKTKYDLVIDGKLRKLRANTSGQITFSSKLDGAQVLELRPTRSD